MLTSTQNYIEVSYQTLWDVLIIKNKIDLLPPVYSSIVISWIIYGNQPKNLIFQSSKKGPILITYY